MRTSNEIIDKSKLVKLLNLTTSTNDHEALVAIRKANQHIQKHNFTWDKLIWSSQKVDERTGSTDRESNSKLSHTDIVELKRFSTIELIELFELILDSCLQNGSRVFIKSVLLQWERSGGLLSRKQWDSIVSIAIAVGAL